MQTQMTTKTTDWTSTSKTLRQRLTDGFTVGKLGMFLLALAVVGALPGYFENHPAPFNIEDLIKDFYENLSSEVVGIAFTVLIIDRLTKLREGQQEKQNLIRQVRSSDSRMAFEALEHLRAQGWLEGGALRGANLQGANMPDADLQGVDLKGTNLQTANLRGAKLQGANLAQTRLQDAELRSADLQGAYLSEAKLESANLGYVNLQGVHDLSDAQLAQVEMLTDATMPDGLRYAGRFNLKGDLEQARADGFDVRDETSMARYYEVDARAYQEGQEWAAKHRPELQGFL